MTSWIDNLVPIAGIALFLWFAWMLIRKLMRRDGHQQAGALHLQAFCTHCGWDGRVARADMKCKRCGSDRLSVTAT